MLRWASVIFWSRSFIIHHAASGRCVAICLGRARFTSVVILYWASSIVFPLSCVTHYPASDLCVVLRLSLLLFTKLHRASVVFWPLLIMRLIMLCSSCCIAPLSCSQCLVGRLSSFCLCCTLFIVHHWTSVF